MADLPAAPEGEYYEGWVYEESSGEWVSVGTFHMRDGDGRVVLWSGVPIDRYRELLVTAETEGPDDGRGAGRSRRRAGTTLDVTQIMSRC